MDEKYKLNDLLVSKFIDLFCYDSEAEEWITKGNKVRSAEDQKAILDIFGEISEDDEKQEGRKRAETSPRKGKAVRKVVRKHRAKKHRVVQETDKGLKRKLDSEACVDFKLEGTAKKQKSCVSVEQEALDGTMKTVSIDFSGGDYTRNLTVSLPDELLGEKVNESNAIYFMGKSVENNATQKPSSFVRNWRLIKIDLDGLHRPSSMMICLSGKSFSDVFVVSDFEAKDFDLEWNAIKSRDVKSRISEYRPQCT